MKRGKPKQKLPRVKAMRQTLSYGAWGRVAKSSAGAERFTRKEV